MNGIGVIAETLRRADHRIVRRYTGPRLSTPHRVLREAKLCQEGARLTTPTIMRIFGVGRSTAKRDMRLLREYGFL